jgi:hypothetical protein
MSDEQWVLLENVEGQLQAEIFKGLLEAQGIKVFLNAQGAVHAYAVTVGSLGMVEILVPSSSYDQARQVLEAYYRGDYEDTEFNEPGEGEDPLE